MKSSTLVSKVDGATDPGHVAHHILAVVAAGGLDTPEQTSGDLAKAVMAHGYGGRTRSRMLVPVDASARVGSIPRTRSANSEAVAAAQDLHLDCILQAWPS